MENDSLFALIFTLDEGDDFKDENVWIKSNPNLDVTVTKRYLKDRIDQCKSNPNLEVDVKTKNFNMYVQSAESWLPDHLVYDSMESVNLNDYKGEQCWTGIDLSAVSDLTAIGLMFPPNEFRKINPDKYVFKVIPYVPGLAIQESSNRDFYQRCINAGHLRDTKSKAVDYDEILKDLLQIN
jgi:phage terminase large subunit-like protein